MKRLLGLFALFLFMFLITGCNKIDDSWNGVYTGQNGYSILIYTADQKTASIAVQQKGETFIFYPVQYGDYLRVSDTELTTIMGEPVMVVKDGTKIKVSLESEEKGVWVDIEGEYVKTKNAKAFNMNQF